MQLILAVLAAVALAGCASVEHLMTATRSTGGTAVLAAAHLAPVGSFEARVAPTYTGLILLRQTTARRLDQGRIDVATAREIQRIADGTRTILDDAVAADRAGETSRANANANAAAANVVYGRRLLEDRSK